MTVGELQRILSCCPKDAKLYLRVSSPDKNIFGIVTNLNYSGGKDAIITGFEDDSARQNLLKYAHQEAAQPVIDEKKSHQMISETIGILRSAT